MKATLHYDNDDIFPVIAFFKGKANYIKFYYKGEPYLLGRDKLPKYGIIRVTNTETEETLWSLNP